MALAHETEGRFPAPFRVSRRDRRPAASGRVKPGGEILRLLRIPLLLRSRKTRRLASLLSRRRIRLFRKHALLDPEVSLLNIPKGEFKRRPSGNPFLFSIASSCHEILSSRKEDRSTRAFLPRTSRAPSQALHLLLTDFTSSNASLRGRAATEAISPSLLRKRSF